MLPFIYTALPEFAVGDYIYIPGIRTAVSEGAEKITAYVVKDGLIPFELALPGLSKDEADIILQGGLINYYRS
jgi:aconitate hydratase